MYINISYQYLDDNNSQTVYYFPPNLCFEWAVLAIRKLKFNTREKQDTNLKTVLK